MKYKIISFLLIIFLFPALVFAHSNHKHSKDHIHKSISNSENISIDKNNISNQNYILVQTKGMFCEYCANSLMKEFEEMHEIKKAYADIKKQEIILILEKDKVLSNSVVRQKIKNSGINLINIKEIKNDKI